MAHQTRKKDTGLGYTKQKRSGGHRGSIQRKKTEKMPQQDAQALATKAENDTLYSLGMAILQGRN